MKRVFLKSTGGRREFPSVLTGRSGNGEICTIYIGGAQADASATYKRDPELKILSDSRNGYSAQMYRLSDEQNLGLMFRFDQNFKVIDQFRSEF